MGKQKIIEWDKVRQYERSLSVAEERIIQMHFADFVEGNPDSFPDNMSSPEARSHYDTFRMTWVITCVFQI